MGLSNDERGWVMTSLSGIACVLGASIICVDLIIRQLPGKRDFRIQDSDTFLSLSLSLSFGVMLFSSLYSMLPSAKKSLIDGGFTPKAAAWTLIACFLGGVVGIQLLSRIMHQFIPSHVVDCEHSHEEEDGAKEAGHDHDHDHAQRPKMQQRRSRAGSLPGHTPLGPKMSRPRSRQASYFGNHNASTPASNGPPRRPSLQKRLTTGISQLTGAKKEHCDGDGPCKGFTDVCGSECFKNVNARGGIRGSLRNGSTGSRPPMSKSATMSVQPTSEATPLLQNIDEESRPSYNDLLSQNSNGNISPKSQPDDTHRTSDQTLIDDDSDNQSPHDDEAHHHHHVPTNAFLSIGLQTSIAIALHKLPEGFITYATNHANPRLGFSVFLALFVHNITEGFAMALPLYLAINSRVKAMFWSFVLGGLSQPLGAGIAAAWFAIAGRRGGGGGDVIGEAVYGGMFAVTAGVMASVALQLFSESLELTHSRGLCMVGAFTGMAILGISSALTA